MSVTWDNGRGFVKTAGGTAKKVSGVAGRAAKSMVNSLGNPPSVPGNPQTFQAFQQWQVANSKIGTQKYWGDSDDAARSLGGIGFADADLHQKNNFRNIRPHSKGKPMPKRKPKLRNVNEQKEEEPDPKNEDLRPPDDPTEVREGMGLPPGDQPFGVLGPAGRRDPLTDVRDVQYAGEEIGNGQQRALGTGASLNFQDQLGRGEVIDTTSRELMPGSHTDQHRQRSRGRTARQNDLLSRNTPAGNSMPWGGGRRIPGMGIYGAGLINEGMDEFYEGKPLGKSAASMVGQSVDQGRSAPNNNAGIGMFERTPSVGDNANNAGIGLFGQTPSAPGGSAPKADLSPLTQPTYTAPRGMGRGK